MAGKAVAEPNPTLDGVFNFRDLSPVGQAHAPLRSGWIFRSDGLHRAPVSDQGLLLNLGIRRVIDLRTDQELEREGRFSADGIDFVRVPIIEEIGALARSMEEAGIGSGSAVLAAHYLDMAETKGPALATAINMIAASTEREQPVVFHCTAGKDRTGVLAALLLRGLGVPADAVADDYARSSLATGHMIAWYRQNTGFSPEDKMREMGLDPSMVGILMSSNRESMVGFLDAVDQRYGTIESYLSHIGVTESIQVIAETACHS